MISLLPLNINVDPVLSTAEGISNFGLIVTTAAFFLIITFVLWITIFRWFKNLIDSMVKDQTKTLTRLLDETRNQNDRLDLIRESLEPELLNKVRIVSNALFDLAGWHTLDILSTVRRENHIADREATSKKIRNLLTVEYQNVRSKLDGYGTYRGKKLSSYTDDSWVELVAKAVEGELYNNNGENSDRAYTNITMIFDKIKIEYYNQIN